MIEPEAVIEPEAAAPPVRRRRAVLAGVTALAMVAGGIAVVAGRGPSDPKPLALMAGGVADDGAGGRAEKTMAAPAAPALGAPAHSGFVYPYGWGVRFEVAGDLPDLPDHATVWRATGSALDRAAVARIASAVGLTGPPVQRDGGWFVEGRDWTLNAYGPGPGTDAGGDTWAVNVIRSRDAGRGDDAASPGDTPVGPVLSPAEAERRVRDLLDRMGAPAGTWKFETTETEIGVGWGCATPAAEMRAGDAVASGSASAATTPAIPAPVPGPTPADKSAPDGSVGACPPPPAPVKGFIVALYPLIDGRRADWPVWNVTLRADGRVEHLNGAWVTFERGDDYKLRGVDAALKELQSPPQAPVGRPEGVTTSAVAPSIAADTPTTTVVSAGVSGSTRSAPSRLPLDSGAAKPATEPARPCPPMPMPMPMPVPVPVPSGDAATTSSSAAGCAPRAPQVVTITGVELGLIQAPVFEEGQARLHLVPSYRFVGRFDNGSPWETSVIALHPDAIAPPPDFPQSGEVRSSTGGGSTGIGPTVTTMPPGAEPAVLSDPDSSR